VPIVKSYICNGSHYIVFKSILVKKNYFTFDVVEKHQAFPTDSTSNLSDMDADCIPIFDMFWTIVRSALSSSMRDVSDDSIYLVCSALRLTAFSFHVATQ
jgi:hypothetical protein